MLSYFIVVAFGIAAVSELAFVPLPALHVRKHVSLHVLFQISLLCKPLLANIALEGLLLLVHASVVKNIPCSSELFVSPVVLADIHDQGLSVELCASHLRVVIEVFQ
jgi:hypothetical protein